jgi:hypothetical protein
LLLQVCDLPAALAAAGLPSDVSAELLASGLTLELSVYVAGGWVVTLCGWTVNFAVISVSVHAGFGDVKQRPECLQSCWHFRLHWSCLSSWLARGLLHFVTFKLCDDCHDCLGSVRQQLLYGNACWHQSCWSSCSVQRSS